MQDAFPIPVPTTTQLVLEHTAVAVAAITGVLAARGKRIDLFGVLVLALVTAFGGGTVRDILVGDLPPVWLRNSLYLLNGTLAALITFFIVRLHSLHRGALLVADACTLALFTIVGARKGVVMHFTPAVSILLGVVTGVVGGILRDVLLGEIPLVFQPEIHLYATASMIGAAAFVGLANAGWPLPLAVGIGTLLVLLLRLMAIRWKLSLPLFEPK